MRAWPDCTDHCLIISAVGLRLQAPGCNPPLLEGTWAACWVSFKLLALAQPEMKKRTQLEQLWAGSPGTSQSNPLPEASVFLLVSGEKDPKVMGRWDCPRQTQSQVWPQRPTAARSHLPPVATGL